MAKKALYRAPDLSRHNGNVNFKAVRDGGYPSVFLRAGYGKNNIDQSYVNNAQACINLRIPVMTYWFMYSYTPRMASEEGRFAVERTSPFWKGCPIAADLEYDTISYAARNGVRIDKRLATDMVAAFLREVKDAGYIPVLYTSSDYMKNYFDIGRLTAEIGRVYIWYAKYAGALSESEKAITDIWQKTSRGRIPGITGNVDINEVYTDIFSDKEDAAGKEPLCNLYIQAFQRAANKDGYRDMDGRMLVEDGIDGPKTQFVRKKINLKAEKTAGGYRTGSRGYLVRWLQERLRELGYNITADGSYGKKTREAVMDFQKKNGLAADGVAGYNTLQRLFYV